MPYTTIDWTTSVVCSGLPLGSDRRSSLVSSQSARSVPLLKHHTAAPPCPHEPGRCASYKTKTNKLCIKWKTALKVVSVGGHGFARILWAATLRQASAYSPQRPGGEVDEVDSGPERSRGEPTAPDARGQCVGADNSEYNNTTAVSGSAPSAVPQTIPHLVCVVN